MWVNLTRKRHVSENGGPPPPPQRQHAALGHRRADAHAQLAVAQLPGLHFGPDQLQRADDRHGTHCHQNNTLQVNNNRKTTTGVFFFSSSYIWQALRPEEERGYPGAPNRTTGSPSAGRSRWSRSRWLGRPSPFTHIKNIQRNCFYLETNKLLNRVKHTEPGGENWSSLPVREPLWLLHFLT